MQEDAVQSGENITTELEKAGSGPMSSGLSQNSKWDPVRPDCDKKDHGAGNRLEKGLGGWSDPGTVADDTVNPGNAVDNRYQVFCMYTSQLHMEEVIIGLRKWILYPDEKTFFPRVERFKKVRDKTLIVYPPLFPNYLFIESREPEDLFLRVRNAQGKAIFQYCQLLRNDEYIYPISPEEDERIATLCDENHILRSSRGYQEGERLIITDGPLKGRAGSIVRINRHKKIAVLMVPFMGDQREIVVGLDVVRKVPGSGNNRV